MTAPRAKRISPASPGEMLRDEFLKPMGLTNYRLAKEIDVPAQRIGEIVAGRRGITADTDLRLCRFFGLSDGLAAAAGRLRHEELRAAYLPRRSRRSSLGRPRRGFQPYEGSLPAGYPVAAM